MTSFSQRITPAHFASYLKNDPIYLEVQEKYRQEQESYVDAQKTTQKNQNDLAREYCWIRSIDAWTGSSHILVRICGCVALFFAQLIKGDALGSEQKEFLSKYDSLQTLQDKIQGQLTKIHSELYQEVALRQLGALMRDYEREDPENQKKFTPENSRPLPDIAWNQMNTHDMEKAAVTLTMMHQGGYADVMQEAKTFLRTQYGFDEQHLIIAQGEGANTKVRSADGINFEQHFNIHYQPPEEKRVLLGTLRIDGNYVFSSEMGQVNYHFSWDQEAASLVHLQLASHLIGL
jgi:hypothetical protein